MLFTPYANPKYIDHTPRQSHLNIEDIRADEAGAWRAPFELQRSFVDKLESYDLQHDEKLDVSALKFYNFMITYNISNSKYAEPVAKN